MRPSGVRLGRAAVEHPARLAVGTNDPVLDLDRLAVRHAIVGGLEGRDVVRVHGGLPLLVQPLERHRPAERAEDAGARVERDAEVPLDAGDVGVDVLVDRLDHVRETRARLRERERRPAPLGHVDQDAVHHHDAVLGPLRVRPVEQDALPAVGAHEAVLALERVAPEQACRSVLHDGAIVGVDARVPRIDRRHRGGCRADEGLEARGRVDQLGLALGVEQVAVDRLVEVRARAIRVESRQPDHAGVGRVSDGELDHPHGDRNDLPVEPADTHARIGRLAPRDGRDQALEGARRRLVRAELP